MEIIQVVQNDVKATAAVAATVAVVAEDVIEKATKVVASSEVLHVEKRLVNIRALHPLTYTFQQLIIIFVCKFCPSLTHSLIPTFSLDPSHIFAAMYLRSIRFNMLGTYTRKGNLFRANFPYQIYRCTTKSSGSYTYKIGTKLENRSTFA